MMLTKEQAIAELHDLVRCRCHVAYKDRGLHDPECHCDSADAVNVIDAALARLAAAEAQVVALTEAATLAMSDMEVAFKPGTSVVELIRLGTGATLRLRAALATVTPPADTPEDRT